MIRNRFVVGVLMVVAAAVTACGSAAPSGDPGGNAGGPLAELEDFVRFVSGTAKDNDAPENTGDFYDRPGNDPAATT